MFSKRRVAGYKFTTPDKLYLEKIRLRITPPDYQCSKDLYQGMNLIALNFRDTLPPSSQGEKYV